MKIFFILIVMLLSFNLSSAEDKYSIHINTIYRNSLQLYNEFGFNVSVIKDEENSIGFFLNYTLSVFNKNDNNEFENMTIDIGSIGLLTENLYCLVGLSFNSTYIKNDNNKFDYTYMFGCLYEFEKINILFAFSNGLLLGTGINF